MQGFYAGLCVIAASIVGSLCALLVKKISHRTNDMFLGFAAGIMLAAAFLGLLPSAFAGEGIPALLIGIAGVVAGALFLSVIDKFVPHIHPGNELGEDRERQGQSRVMLLVIAIAIHNIPEGLATGIAFSDGLTQSAYLVAISMIIQKVPEGLVVAVPMLVSGVKKSRVFGISCVVGLMMLPGLIAGILLGELPPFVNAFFYAFTFGAIVYVVSSEIIPESHTHGFEKPATFSVIAGVLTVLAIDFLL